MISDPLSVTENYPLRQSNYLILHIPCVQSQILPTGPSIAKLSDYLLLIAVSRQTGGTDIWLEEWLHFFFLPLLRLLTANCSTLVPEKCCKIWRSQGKKKFANSSFRWQKHCYSQHFKVFLCQAAELRSGEVIKIVLDKARENVLGKILCWPWDRLNDLIGLLMQWQ